MEAEQGLASWRPEGNKSDPGRAHPRPQVRKDFEEVKDGACDWAGVNQGSRNQWCEWFEEGPDGGGPFKAR